MSKAHDNFSKHAKHYADNSAIQKQIGDILLSNIPQNCAPATILEIGCGTGYLTQKLVKAFPHAQITATDISNAMLTQAQTLWPLDLKHPNWRTLDGQNIEGLLSQSYDLIISNMCIQWLDDINAAYTTWKKHLTTNGYILTSRPCSNAFWQWKETLKHLNLPNGIIKFQDTPYHHAVINIPTQYSNTLAFLRSVKASGASTAHENHKPISVQNLKKACSHCDTLYKSTIDWEIVIDKLTKNK